MGLNLKTLPVGIDYEIDKIQKGLFNELTTIGWINYESYNRAYRNRKFENTFPEVYIGKGEYKESLFDDKFNVTSFFLAEEEKRQTEDFQVEQDISIIFQANLKKLYPNILHRADEEMQRDIYLSLKKIFVDEKIQTIITGVDNVYRTLEIKSDKKFLYDMSFFHILRIDFKLNFLIDECSENC